MREAIRFLNTLTKLRTDNTYQNSPTASTTNCHKPGARNSQLWRSEGHSQDAVWIAFPQEALGKNLFPCLFQLLELYAVNSLAHGASSSIFESSPRSCVSGHTAVFSVRSPSACLPLPWTLGMALGFHPENPAWSPCLKILRFIVSGKLRLPYKVTYTGSRDQDLRTPGGQYSVHHTHSIHLNSFTQIPSTGTSQRWPGTGKYKGYNVERDIVPASPSSSPVGLTLSETDASYAF